MTPSKGFPIKYIERTETEYLDIPWYQFVLIPKQAGSSLKEFVGAAQDLRAALENKQLSESVPHFSADGQKLTVEFLREEVTKIIAGNDAEWVEGCTGLLIVHHTDRYADLVALLSNLPVSGPSGGQRKLLSVSHADRTYCLEIELEVNDHISPSSFIFGLVNPVDPAAVRLVERLTADGLRFNDLYAGKQVMEWFAFRSFCIDLSNRLDTPVEGFNGKYEPLGDSTYPDFEMSIGGKEWAVEVARVESGMTSYIEVERRLDQRGFNRVLRNYITEDRVQKAMVEEIKQKAELRTKCSEYSLHCLLLVDVVDSIGAKTAPIWHSCPLSRFDVVAVIKFSGAVEYIKGDPA